MSEIIPAKVWLFLAIMAGAITGALQDSTSSLKAKLFAFFVGLTTSFFVGPLLLSRFAPGIEANNAESAGFYYLFATCANAAIPELIKVVKKGVGGISQLRGKTK